MRKDFPPSSDGVVAPRLVAVKFINLQLTKGEVRGPSYTFSWRWGIAYCTRGRGLGQAGRSANKDVVALVVLDASGIALVRHGVHGSTPTRSKSSRASST